MRTMINILKIYVLTVRLEAALNHLECGVTSLFFYPGIIPQVAFDSFGQCTCARCLVIDGGACANKDNSSLHRYPRCSAENVCLSGFSCQGFKVPITINPNAKLVEGL